MGTRPQLAELERPERDPLEHPDRVPDPLAHAPDLALSPLADRQLERVGGEPRDPRRRGSAVLQHDALPQRS